MELSSEEKARSADDWLKSLSVILSTPSRSLLIELTTAGFLTLEAIPLELDLTELVPEAGAPLLDARVYLAST